ncbi:MAG: hypothetical protein Q9183_004424 [Haloplaca sp. 2 TL-2023]
MTVFYAEKPLRMSPIVEDLPSGILPDPNIDQRLENPTSCSPLYQPNATTGSLLQKNRNPVVVVPPLHIRYLGLVSAIAQTAMATRPLDDHLKDHLKDHHKDHLKDHLKDHRKDHRKDHLKGHLEDNDRRTRIPLSRQDRLATPIPGTRDRPQETATSPEIQPTEHAPRVHKSMTRPETVSSSGQEPRVMGIEIRTHPHRHYHRVQTAVSVVVRKMYEWWAFLWCRGL